LRLKDIDPKLPFSEWRGQQEATNDTMIDKVARPAGVTIVAFNAPTGSGKSLLAITVGLRLKVKTLILTPTIALQSQYMRDFGELAVELKGKDNYQCINKEWLAAHPDERTVAQVRCNGYNPANRYRKVQREPGELTGDESDTSKDNSGECAYVKDCPYYGIALPRAKDSKVLVTNYAVLMYNPEIRKMPFKLVICDEAHTMPIWLEMFFKRTLSSDEFDYTPSVKFNKTTPSKVDDWFAWFNKVETDISSDLRKLSSKVRAMDEDRPVAPEDAVDSWRTAFEEATRRERVVRELLDKIKHIQDNRALGWICNREYSPDDKSHKVTFSPINMPEREDNPIITATNRTTDDNVSVNPKQPTNIFDRVIVMSGTLSQKTLDFLKLQTNLTPINSTFPPERCPIMYVPTVKMSGKVSDMDYMLWASKIDQMLAARPDRRGLVLTNSYARMEQYLNRTTQKSRLIIQHRGMKQLEALSRFQHATGPKVLLAPAMNVGIDLPDDQCRFIIMSKIPYPTLTPIMKARNAADTTKTYYDAITLEVFAQGASRGFRSESDWCEVIITDDGWPRFWAKVESFAYDWLRDRIKAGTNRMLGGIQ
jgi:Rad3-related DNA helicase